MMVDPTYTDDDDETGLVPAIPAATLVLLREADGSPPDYLMVRRSSKMRFAAGAAVFPGGRVDADDHRLAQIWAPTLPPADAAARIAAIRETLEETALAVGLDGDAAHDPARRLAMRDALMREQPLSSLMGEFGLSLDVDALVPFSRWRPNFNHDRVFDTRFYIARAPSVDHDLVVVESENSEAFWIGAGEAMRQADSGELHMIFPTRRNIERLAGFASYDDALDSARRFPPRRITPFVEERDGRSHLCIRDDCGYPVTSEVFDSAMRG